MINEWLNHPEFQKTYLHRIRQILESDGTNIGDEPAHLWSFVVVQNRPIGEILTSNYTVTKNGDQLMMMPRPSEHGSTGLLTMKGYINGKPGLPHYNYAARVLTGFLGIVFDVPQEAFDARATATATSTVDPASICYSCHKLITPLAHQRLAWDDQGNYRTHFEDGRLIDDSDQNLVEHYPFSGKGLSSFALSAIRKEGFIRRMINVHALMFFGRLLRHETDERDLYYQLFQLAQNGQGQMKAMIKALLQSTPYETAILNTPTP